MLEDRSKSEKIVKPQIDYPEGGYPAVSQAHRQHCRTRSIFLWARRRSSPCLRSGFKDRSRHLHTSTDENSAELTVLETFRGQGISGTHSQARL